MADMKFRFSAHEFWFGFAIVIAGNIVAFLFGRDAKWYTIEILIGLSVSIIGGFWLVQWLARWIEGKIKDSEKTRRDTNKPRKNRLKKPNG
jgi:hypothetical protein